MKFERQIYRLILHVVHGDQAEITAIYRSASWLLISRKIRNEHAMKSNWRKAHRAFMIASDRPLTATAWVPHNAVPVYTIK